MSPVTPSSSRPLSHFSYLIRREPLSCLHSDTIYFVNCDSYGLEGDCQRSSKQPSLNKETASHPQNIFTTQPQQSENRHPHLPTQSSPPQRLTNVLWHWYITLKLAKWINHRPCLALRTLNWFSLLRIGTNNCIYPSCWSQVYTVTKIMPIPQIHFPLWWQECERFVIES